MTTAVLAQSTIDLLVANPTLLRPPVVNDPPGPALRSCSWTPDLSPAEQATLTDLTTMAKFGISADLSLAEFQAIKSDLVTARTYVGLASPTAAQTAAALKSLIRIVGALLRQ
jgi:hypothetical protein